MKLGRKDHDRKVALRIYANHALNQENALVGAFSDSDSEIFANLLLQLYCVPVLVLVVACNTSINSADLCLKSVQLHGDTSHQCLHPPPGGYNI